jgi:hypothetical protein
MARKSQRGSGSGHKHNNGQRGAGGCGYKPVRRSQKAGGRGCGIKPVRRSQKAGGRGCSIKPVRRYQSGGRKQNSRKSRRSKRKSFVLVCDPSNGNCA